MRNRMQARYGIFREQARGTEDKGWKGRRIKTRRDGDKGWKERRINKKEPGTKAGRNGRQRREGTGVGRAGKVRDWKGEVVKDY